MHSSTPVVLSPEEQTQIRRAMCVMPFAAHPGVPIPRDLLGESTVTGDAIVAFLEGLASVLGEHAARHSAQSLEFDQLRADVAAVRRLLGTDVVPAPAKEDAEVDS